MIQEYSYGNYIHNWEHKGGFNGFMQKIIGLIPGKALEEIAVREI